MAGRLFPGVKDGCHPDAASKIFTAECVANSVAQTQRQRAKTRRTLAALRQRRAGFRHSLWITFWFFFFLCCPHLSLFYGLFLTVQGHGNQNHTVQRSNQVDLWGRTQFKMSYSWLTPTCIHWIGKIIEFNWVRDDMISAKPHFPLWVHISWLSPNFPALVPLKQIVYFPLMTLVNE